MVGRTLGPGAVALACVLWMASSVAGAGATTTREAMPTQAVFLVHHPFDHVDPFGVAVGDPSAQVAADTFSSRHEALRPASGAFPFPTFVADGVLPILQVPDPAAPYASMLGAYGNATRTRLAVDAAATLELSATTDASLQVQLVVTPRPGAAGQVTAWVAVTEDPIRLALDRAISNGVDDHRFTVRALRQVADFDLEDGLVLNVSLPLKASWSADHLRVAAWVESGAGGRFATGEVLQAAAVAPGQHVVQRQRAVLVEVYSATWCTPCLYGDLATEALAVQYAGAAPTSPQARLGYFVPPAQPVLAVAAALAGAVVATLLVWPRRRRPA